MGCKCGNIEKVFLKHLQLCKACFLNTLKKRAQKEMRHSGWFKRDQRVLLVVNDEAPSHLLKDVFKAVNTPLTVDESSEIDLSYDKILLPSLADDVAASFLDEIMNAKNSENNAKFMLPLKCISKEEIVEYAKLLNLQYSPSNSKTHEFLDSLEEKYPGTKFSVMKSKEFS